jgi:hypothetical protein
MIAHLIRTDLRRFRWVLLAWCALLAVHTGLLLTAPRLVTNVLRFQRIQASLGILAVTLFIASMVVTAMIVQGDSTIGTDAFWLTRPIAPLRLLAAKGLLLAAALVLLPGLVEVAVMVASRMPASAIVGAAAAATATGLFWLAWFMATASVTRSLGTLALLWLGTIVGFVLLMFLLTVLAASFEAGGIQTISLAPNQSATSGALWMAGLAAAFVVVVVVQYRQRRRPLAVLAGVLVAVVAFDIAAFSPLRVLDPPPFVQPAWTNQPGSAQLTVASAVAHADGQPAQARTFRFPLRITGLPPGWTQEAWLVDAVVTSQGRAESSSPLQIRAPIPLANDDSQPAHVAVQNVLSVKRLIQGPSRQPVDTIGFVYPDGVVLPPLPVTVAYNGRFAIDFSRAELTDTSPLSRGATVRDRNYSLGIDDVRFERGRIVLRATESSISSSVLDSFRTRHELYAVNDARSEAIQLPLGFAAGMSSGPSALPFNAHVPVFGWTFTRSGVGSVLDRETADLETRLTADWLHDARLALIRLTSPGFMLEREISIPALTLCSQRLPGC